MPTGSRKSPLFVHIFNVMQRVRQRCGVADGDPTWIITDATFEKMGTLMQENGCRLLGFYDEPTSFLTQINLYRGKNISDSHELSLFLQLCNGHPWRRDTVGGEANFVMNATRLTIGGYTQAGVARSMIDMPANAEKGLSHRFLWFFPKPLYGKMSSLGRVDNDFMDKLTGLLARQWRCPADKELPARIFKLPSKEGIFGEFFDRTQDYLKTVSVMDEFLAGLLSKTRSHVLRVAAILHVLFAVGYEGEISETVSDKAMKAAIMCKEVEKFKNDGPLFDGNGASEDMIAAHCLTLPGETLCLTPLLGAKKFCKRGNKDGALRTFTQLEQEGLGKTFVIRNGKAHQFEFKKKKLVDEEKLVLKKKLQKYNVSLSQYVTAFNQQEIKPSSKIVLAFQEDTTPPTVRKSPRLTPNKTTGESPASL